MTNEERFDLDSLIDGVPYMKPAIYEVDNFIYNYQSQDSKKAVLEAFNYIEEFMRNAQPAVEIIQRERLNLGEIRDMKQSGKAIAGAMFPKLIHYIFLKNKEVGNIPQEIFFTRSKKNAEKLLNENFVIYISSETQTPDCDIVIYNNKTKKFIILSAKTSMRERAGQTYKWKLLLEIANSGDKRLKNKYRIKYKGTDTPLVCFVTADFYGEINNPQHRGMFRFFDCSFVARSKSENDLVRNLSSLPKFIEDNLC